jgi:ribosome biogenesis protein NSA1
VALGGEGHQLRVWDLSAVATASASSRPAPEPLFAGKAGKPSRSGLQDLAHVTAVSYVPGRDDKLVGCTVTAVGRWLGSWVISE